MTGNAEYNPKLLEAAYPHLMRKTFGGPLPVMNLPWWRLWWIRWRGDRVEAHCDGWTTVVYNWRGMTYVVESYFEPRGEYLEYKRYERNQSDHGKTNQS